MDETPKMRLRNGSKGMQRELDNNVIEGILFILSEALVIGLIEARILATIVVYESCFWRRAFQDDDTTKALESSNRQRYRRPRVELTDQRLRDHDDRLQGQHGTSSSVVTRGQPVKMDSAVPST
jgi:hypothetical protein